VLRRLASDHSPRQKESRIKVLKSVTQSADGGKSVTLTPDTNCAGTDDSGTLYIRVTKILGATVHSNSPFSVSINPWRPQACRTQRFRGNPACSVRVEPSAWSLCASGVCSSV